MNDNKRSYKDIILFEAKDIALKQGISKISIRTVAKNSGIAIGTVYNYFPSKGDLLIAVIEDFWEGVFTDIDWRSFAYSDFYDNLEKVYTSLYIYLNKFKENWLEQLAVIKTQEKLIGRQKEKEYFETILEKIKVLIDMDKVLHHFSWTETISKEKIAEFIFDNMVLNLRQGKQNINFFIEILKIILSH